MSDRGMRAAAAMHRANRAPKGLEQIIVEHMNFGKKRAGMNRTIFFALALAGEAGELCNIIKKKLRGDRKYRGKAGKELFDQQVNGETVDLGNYVYMMAAHREIPLTRRMLEKLLEVEARDDDWNRLPVKLSKRPRRLPTNCRCTVKKPTLDEVARVSLNKWVTTMDRKFKPKQRGPTRKQWRAAFKATKPRRKAPRKQTARSWL